MGPIQPVLLGMIEQPFFILPDNTTTTNPYFGQESTSEGEATTCSSSVYMDTAGRNRLGRNASAFVWGKSETVRQSIQPLRVSRIIVPNWCGQVKDTLPRACYRNGGMSQEQKRTYVFQVRTRWGVHVKITQANPVIRKYWLVEYLVIRLYSYWETGD